MNRQIESYLNNLTKQQQKEIFDLLRSKFPIHALEAKWNTDAEFILEAISRSQDITQRGVRGIIAELAFSRHIIAPLSPEWTEVPIVGDQPYDSLIEDNDGHRIKIQTKNQRLVKGIPLHPNATLVRHYPHVDKWYIAETQKTRYGKSKKKKANTEMLADTESEALEEQPSTRPYRFGEFDILSICLHPSTRDWSSFMFTPACTLFTSPKNSELMATFQPVPPTPQYAWTNNLLECIEWVLHPEKMPTTPGKVEGAKRAKKTKSAKLHKSDKQIALKLS